VSTGQVLGQTTSPPTSSYSLLLTTDPGHVRAAQRLRHQALGAEFGLGSSALTGLDVDRFDAFCDHLVVRENATGEIVGTYRLLPPDAARAAGGLYAESEFDCAALDRIRGALVETGRSCVAPEHRTGAVVGMVWAGILRYLLLTGNRWLVGCASVPLADGGSLASGVWQRVAARHLSPATYRMHPLRPWTPVPVGASTLLPPLLRGYLRLGAWVCGPPAYDHDFGCADFPVLLDLDRLDTRYARHLLGSGE
jgi:putative hemolysin